MIAADKAAWIVLFAPVLTYFAGVFVGIFIGRSGEQDKRARRDVADAEQMRAAIRNLDDRVEEFAPSTVAYTQSSSGRNCEAGTPPTALVSSPPSSVRRCPIGPEQCCCDVCLASGVPPRP